MNNLERLKRAEEAESMGILVMPWPKDCYCCEMFAQEEIDGKVVREYCYAPGGQCFKNIPDEPLEIPSWCPLRKAIGIIEPGCHVRYFVEEEE